jgi:predicted TIM-barrel fold metal-dependent hydrolase
MSTYLVISSDGHAGPPAEIYRDYLEPEWREAFDAHQEAVSAGRQVNTAFVEEWDEETGDHDLKAAYDPATRDTILDTEGVAAEVLFPDADVLGTGKAASSPFGSGLGSGADADPEAVKAGARAHNRWLAEFCETNPHRRIGVAVVPVTAGVDDAVASVHAAAAAGLRGVMVPTRWFDAPAYIDGSYDPFWAACAETGLVLHTHSGAGPADYTMGPGFLSIYAAEAWWWAARPFWVFVLSGVFERHPDLKYSIAENGAWWVPDIVQRMDEKWEGAHNTRKFGDAFKMGLDEKPSFFVDRNCFFAASTPGVEDIGRRHQVGIGNLLWGNDFPHPEGTFPYTRELVRRRFKDVPRDECHAILGHNAVDLYGIDTAALAPLVERIGPLVEDIHGETQLQEVPEDRD